ncbi:hypothetical protein MNBD_GAMMA07-519 [hydrothermal vent metagenome]|uniref:Lipoprotein n=1 Tax=hydrothermal vent metagenome TaxID=652676 RepID=A0A3B0WKA7_9ZZZZ
MKKLIMLSAILIVVSGCSEEQQNKLSRLGVTWLEGNYKVTFSEGVNQKVWVVKNGKVTTESAKGYYYFWAQIDGKKRYVQAPISRTYIEETGN